MRNRIFAILNWKKDRKDNVEKEILSKLPKMRDGDKVLVFYKKSDYTETPVYNIDGSVSIEAVPMSDEDGHNRAAGLNTVVEYLKSNYSGNRTYAYTICDSIQFKKDPTIFCNEIEKMMDKLKLDVWLNTYTDGCNFVFNKFDGRVSVAINEPELKSIYDKTIIWTSHANPNVMVLDIDKLESGKMFDDRFDIPMFWIIKYLCERARDKKGFMNHYPTIEDEIGVYKCGNFGGIEPTQEQLKKEDELFKSFNLDHSPNMSVEVLMDFIIDRLKS